MVVEKYQKVYPFDSAYGRYGFQISNDNDDAYGDVNLPGLKPYKVKLDTANKMLNAITNVNFGECASDGVTFRYVKRGLQQLLLGEKSDWKITYVSFFHGKLRLVLKNRKLCKIEQMLNTLDLQPDDSHEEIAELDCKESDISNRVEVDIEVFSERGLLFNLAHKRKDLNGETDFYEIYVSKSMAKIKESHRLNPACRETFLSFVDEDEKYEDLGDDLDGEVMVADIIEYR